MKSRWVAPGLAVLLALASFGCVNPGTSDTTTSSSALRRPNLEPQLFLTGGYIDFFSNEASSDIKAKLVKVGSALYLVYVNSIQGASGHDELIIIRFDADDLSKHSDRTLYSTVIGNRIPRFKITNNSDQLFITFVESAYGGVPFSPPQNYFLRTLRYSMRSDGAAGPVVTHRTSGVDQEPYSLQADSRNGTLYLAYLQGKTSWLSGLGDVYPSTLRVEAFRASDLSITHAYASATTQKQNLSDLYAHDSLIEVARQQIETENSYGSNYAILAVNKIDFIEDFFTTSLTSVLSSQVLSVSDPQGKLVWYVRPPLAIGDSGLILSRYKQDDGYPLLFMSRLATFYYNSSLLKFADAESSGTPHWLSRRGDQLALGYERSNTAFVYNLDLNTGRTLRSRQMPESVCPGGAKSYPRTFLFDETSLYSIYYCRTDHLADFYIQRVELDPAPRPWERPLEGFN